MVWIYIKQLLSDEEFSKQENNFKKYAQESTLDNLDTYKSKKNRQRKLIGEMLAYRGLKECFDIDDKDIIFEYGEKGKPFLKGVLNVYFNISHSGEWVVCALSDGEVGIDIEQIRDARLEVANRFFAEKEICDLKKLSGELRNEYFFLLWTVKESYLKYLGTGLSKPLNSFIVSENSDGISVLDSIRTIDLSFRIIDIDSKYKLSLCTNKKDEMYYIVKC